MSEDKKIRESYFKRDKDFNEKMKEEMQEEENMLKSYFKEYKKPVAEDPSIVKREDGSSPLRMGGEILSPFRVFSKFYQDYWNLECATPEERYILNCCKDVHIEIKIGKGLTISIIFTAFLSYKVRMIVTPKVHFLSFLVGISSGILYGIINSSRYTIEKFQSLGDQYALGRSTLFQIEKYRMDKKM